MSFALIGAVVSTEEQSINLKPLEKYVLLILSSHADENRYCYPSVDTLCAETFLSRSSVKLHLKSLCSKNIITKTQRWHKNGHQSSNIYQINILPGKPKIIESSGGRDTTSIDSDGGRNTTQPGRNTTQYKNLSYEHKKDLTSSLHITNIKHCTSSINPEHEKNLNIDDFYEMTESAHDAEIAGDRALPFRTPNRSGGRTPIITTTGDADNSNYQPQKILSSTSAKTKKSTENQNKEAIILPEWLDPELWLEFVQHRQQIKKPVADKAQKLLLTKLTALKESGHNPTEVVQESIMNGWSGLFPTKKQNQGSNNTQRRKSNAEIHSDACRKTLDLIADATESSSMEEESIVNESNSLPMSWIEGIFLKFESKFGHLWTSRHSNETQWKITKSDWAQGLYGISSPEINQALVKCMRLTFAPSLDEFKAICLGVPMENDAYLMAMRRNFSHPLIKLCLSKLDDYTWRQMSDTQARKIFSPAYVGAISEFFNKKLLELPTSNEKPKELPNAWLLQDRSPDQIKMASMSV